MRYSNRTRAQLAALLYKEWLKTRYAILGVGVAWAIALLFNFILVHRMLRLQGAPAVWEAILYQDLNLLSTLRLVPLAVGLTLGMAQFVPEVRQKRLKLTLHLPLTDAQLLGVMYGYGYAVQVVLAGLALIASRWLLLPLFPREIINSCLLTALPWFVTGVAAYGLVGWICIEPAARRRVAYGAVSCMSLYLSYLSNALEAYAPFLLAQLLFAFAAVPVLGFGALARFREGATASDAKAAMASLTSSQRREEGTGYIKNISYALLTLLGAFLLAIYLPYCYHLAFDKKFGLPFTVYSGVTRTFAIFEGGANDGRYRDDAGNVYTRAEFDSILPTIYYTQLARDGRFPDSLFGVAVSIEDMSRTFFSFHARPAELNAHRIPLYPIINTESQRVVITAASEAFRWGAKGIEIVRMEGNAVDSSKTKAFRAALGEVKLPVTICESHPASRKAYDNGYIIADAAGTLWQLRQQDGAPRLRRLAAPQGESLQAAWVTEYDENTTLGYVSAASGRLYRIEAASGHCKELPLGGFSPRKESLLVFGNMFDQTIRIVRDTTVRYVAVANTVPHRRLRSYTLAVPSAWSDRAVRWLFPFELSLTSSTSSYIYPRVASGFTWRSVPLCVLLAVVSLPLMRGERKGWQLLKAIGVLLLGVYLFIPFLLWRR